MFQFAWTIIFWKLENVWEPFLNISWNPNRIISISRNPLIVSADNNRLFAIKNWRVWNFTIMCFRLRRDSVAMVTFGPFVFNHWTKPETGDLVYLAFVPSYHACYLIFSDERHTYLVMPESRFAFILKREIF